MVCERDPLCKPVAGVPREEHGFGAGPVSPMETGLPEVAKDRFEELIEVDSVCIAADA